ncbi:GntP family permease [Gallaecimonas mangrovi]|uniref:GntP family permease n=1 Tax=Gallaecimonas mangrovi TaxID=2291597 RepID=UPI000E203232|nr:GntP family permease [Gallaecimonas mangrovi]
MGLLGILLALGLLIYLAYRGWSTLILSPLLALLAAFFAGQPLLASWTQLYMTSAGGFFLQYFPLFLLGAIFGKLMEDSGAMTTIANTMMQHMGAKKAMLAVVLAGALVTYGGVSLFVAFFVLGPMAQALFRQAQIPRRLMPAALMLGTSTFTMSAMPGTPSIQNAIPMPFLGTTPYAAPGLGLIASALMLAVGLLWLGRAQRQAKAKGEGFGDDLALNVDALTADDKLREMAAITREFDTAELSKGQQSQHMPGFWLALLPLLVVIAVNMVMSLWLLPNANADYLAAPEWGSTNIHAVAGVWAVITALGSAIIVAIVINKKRLTALRKTLDAGANASVLPVINVACLVGFGAVIAALPAFQSVRDALLAMNAGPLVSMALTTNILCALTGSASGGLTIALDTLASTFMHQAQAIGLDPALLHRVAVLACGTLDSLPHNGAVITLLAVCGCKHKESYLDLFVVSILGAVTALVAVLILGSLWGSF